MTDHHPYTDRDLVVTRHRQTAIERIRTAAEDLVFTKTAGPALDTSALAEFEAGFESFAFASFEIDGLNDEFQLAMGSVSRGGRGLVDGYVTRLLSSPAMRTVLPELAIADSLNPQLSISTDTFGSLDSLMLDGSLAIALRDGGPHRQLPAPHALALARDLRQSLFGDRFDDIHITISTGWSTWFHDMSWDYAWIITDYHRAQAHLLCVSGND